MYICLCSRTGWDLVHVLSAVRSGFNWAVSKLARRLGLHRRPLWPLTPPWPRPWPRPRRDHILPQRHSWSEQQDILPSPSPVCPWPLTRPVGCMAGRRVARAAGPRWSPRCRAGAPGPRRGSRGGPAATSSCGTDWASEPPWTHKTSRKNAEDTTSDHYKSLRSSEKENKVRIFEEEIMIDSFR